MGHAGVGTTKMAPQLPLSSTDAPSALAAHCLAVLSWLPSHLAEICAGDVELLSPSHPVMAEDQRAGTGGAELAPAGQRLGSAANPRALPDEPPGNVPARQSADGGVEAMPGHGSMAHASSGTSGGGRAAATASAASAQLAGSKRAPATESPASSPATAASAGGTATGGKGSPKLPPPWRRKRKPFRTASLISQPSEDPRLAHMHSGGLLTPSGMAGDLRHVLCCSEFLRVVPAVPTWALATVSCGQTASACSTATA